MPRGVMSFGGYFTYGFWYGPGGKARAGKQKGYEGEEEKVIVTEHNDSFITIGIWALVLRRTKRFGASKISMYN